MLTQRAPALARFTRNDATRLGIAAAILILVLTAILGADILPEESILYTEGEVARADIVAPRAIDFDSDVLTEEARTAARAAVPPQYTYSTDKAIAIAAEQAIAFDTRVARIDTAFDADFTPLERQGILQVAVPGLPEVVRATLVELGPARWTAIRTEAARILNQTLLPELVDTDVDLERTRLAGRMGGDLDETERMLAAALIAPLVVANSSFSQQRWDEAREAAAAAVEPVQVTIAQAQIVVRNGERLSAADIETIEALRIGENAPDIASFAGWFLLAVLVVGMLLAWIWRFRPSFWHRDNVLVLIGLLLAGMTLALKITAGRQILGFFLPTAAIGMLLAVLLDASVATVVIAVIAIVGGALNGASLEFAAYTFLGGMAGVIAVRKGDRLQVFVQAAIAVFIVNAMVVTVFSLLGARDIRGVLELWLASGVSAAGSSVAAIGTFAVLGSVFGILTVFQLLELANPITAPAPTTPGRDAGHLPPLVDGRESGRTCRRGHRGGPPGDSRGSLLPRCRQVGEPVGLHREPGRCRKHPRSAGTGNQRPGPQAARRRWHRYRLRGEAPQGADRVHPAASRDGDHELLPRPSQGAGGRALWWAGDGGGRQGDGWRRRAPVPARRPQAANPRGGADHAGRWGRGVRPIACRT